MREPVGERVTARIVLPDDPDDPDDPDGALTGRRPRQPSRSTAQARHGHDGRWMAGCQPV
jgi:hypothetical protein